MYQVITPGYIEGIAADLFKSFSEGADGEKDNRHILEEQYDEYSPLLLLHKNIIAICI